MPSALSKPQHTLLGRVSNVFLPAQLRNSHSADVRRQRIFLLSNLLGPILVGVITFTTWVLLGYLDPNAPVSLASTTMSIVWVAAIRFGVPYKHLIVFALLHFIGVTAWFSWVDGGIQSAATPWLVVMPVICVFFADGWRRYLSLSAILGCLIALLAAEISGYTFPTITSPEALPAAVGISAIFAAGYLSFMCSVMISLNERNEARLDSMANRDALTGVLNRRGLQQSFNALTGNNHCMVAIDLDHFKAVNDLFGHDAGDRVLQQFSSVLEHSLRQPDLVARLGGEEFAVLLVDSNQSDSYDVIERLRKNIANTQFEIPGKQPIQSITFSAGVVHIGEETNLDKVLAHADHLMYKAKNKGRNQVLQAKISSLMLVPENKQA